MAARVLVLADVPNWAWGRKAAAYQRYLSDEFEVCIAYHGQVSAPLVAFDLIHTFEFPQLRHITGGPPVLSGLTAHVWQTWGAERVQRWADQCVALHANSRLLEAELRPFHPRIYYAPNGVDPDYWQRTRPHPSGTVACHIGKPNPRKGAGLIAEACARVGIPLILVQRTSQIALPQEAIRELYQDVTVQVTASDMDGTPGPMLESAACSNALVSTKIGNMPELIRDGVTGWFVERSAESIADRLAWCRDHRTEMIAMGVAAREAVVADWTWARQVEHVRRMWRDVLGGTPG
jgi:glycosyltransferase involved in cell wall biosynthesis